ncbi:unnamed protein product [Calicophoron daubneyi]|uniref:Uncharacterized protein n=1 Tax=Calicophoron daubneyi TaxID=300641 RepID=A0AAV2TF26_CALDB
MRITLASGFWKSNCAPFFYGVWETGGRKSIGRLCLHECYETPAGNVRTESIYSKIPDTRVQRSERPVTIFVMPSWHLPVKLRSAGFHEGESSGHRNFVYILGLAVGLISLSSLRFFEFIDWLSKHTLISDPNERRQSDAAKSRGDGPEYFRYTYNPEDGISLANDPPVNTRGFQTLSMKPFRYYVNRSNLETNRLPATSLAYSTSAEPTYVGQLADPIGELFYLSPLSCLDAALNCPHFPSGSNQICILCWLNAPKAWVFGPSFGLFDRAAQFEEEKTIRKSADFSASAMKISCTTDGVAGGCYPQWDEHVVHAKGVLSTQTRHGSLTDPLTLVTRNLTLKKSNEPDVTIKQERSAGDGAPAQASQDKPLAALSLLNRPNFHHCRQSVIKWAALDSVPEQYSSSPQLCPQAVEKLFCPGAPDYSQQPLFYTPESDLDLSSRQRLASSVNTRLTHSTETSPRQLRISASRVVSKALSLLNADKGSGPRTTTESSDNVPLLYRMIDKYTNDKQHRMPCIQRTPSSSNCSLANDAFEFDEMYTEYQIPYFKPVDEDILQPDEPTDEDEAHLFHLLDTLSSLLNSKSDSLSSAGDKLRYSIEETGSETEQSTAVSGKTEKPSDSLEFTEIFQKATDLSDDLVVLEEVLDRLHYKLKANQIELEQAEDNLDFAWHLHDNLDGLESSSNSSVSHMGSKASLNAGTFSDVSEEYGLSLEQTKTYTMQEEYSEYREAQCPKLEDSTLLSSSQTMESSVDAQVNPNFYLKPDSLYNSFCSSCTVESPCNYPTNSISVSTMDSGLDHSGSLSSCMINSMPEPNLSVVGKSLNLWSAPASRHSAVPGLTSDLHSRSKRTRSARRRFTTSDFMDKRAKTLTDLEPSPDVDGFWYPDYTFDDDGLVNWSKPANVVPRD